jgi:hypothetical protein
MYNKGGVRITNDFKEAVYSLKHKYPNINTRQAALDYFLENSTFSILTNNSISCITLVAKFKKRRGENTINPFMSMRSNNVSVPVEQLLLKLFVTNTQEGWDAQDGWYKTPTNRGEYDGIDITSFDTFKNEINIQNDIYKKSFTEESSVFDPICPAIIAYKMNLNTPESILIYRELSKKRLLHHAEQKRLNEILDTTQHYGNSISILAMEFMEGFDIASNVLERISNHKQWVIMAKMIFYEFHRLNKLGYFHGDSHLGNVMINTKYPYFTTHESDLMGRAILIDFGRTKLIKQGDKESIYIRLNREYSSKFGKVPLRFSPQEYDFFRTKRLEFIKHITEPNIVNYFNIELNGKSLWYFLKNTILKDEQYMSDSIKGGRETMVPFSERLSKIDSKKRMTLKASTTPQTKMEHKKSNEKDDMNDWFSSQISIWEQNQKNYLEKHPKLWEEYPIKGIEMFDKNEKAFQDLVNLEYHVTDELEKEINTYHSPVSSSRLTRRKHSRSHSRSHNKSNKRMKL